MVSYPQLEHYLEMPPAPVNRPESPVSDFIRTLIDEVKNEDPLPLNEAFMLDLVCTQDVFEGLWFEAKQLWNLVQKTWILPRQIIGINSPRMVYIHNPCMRKLGEHLNHLTQKEKTKVQKSMHIIASIRGQFKRLGIWNEDTGWRDKIEDLLKRAVHHHMCQRMKLPTN